MPISVLAKMRENWLIASALQLQENKTTAEYVAVSFKQDNFLGRP